MLTYEQQETFNKNFRVVVLKDGKWTYEIDPALARITSARDDCWEAHWDSGQPDTPAVNIAYWTGTEAGFAKLSVEARDPVTLKEVRWDKWDDVQQRWVHNPEYATALRFTHPTTNATEDDTVRIETDLRVAAWLEWIKRTITNMNIIRVGDKVRVIKGRKVPKGEYEVTKHADGDFGPYVDLRDAKQSYRYVAVGNVEAIPNYDGVFGIGSAFHTTNDMERAFYAKLGESNFKSATEWLVFADWIEETNTLPTCGLNSSRDLPAGYFAEFLRLHVSRRPGATAPNEGDVLYANQRRRQRSYY